MIGTLNKPSNTPHDAHAPRLARLGVITEPLGYIDGPNLYTYERGNPVVGLDPLGLFNIEWGSGFTDAEKKKINDSLGRIQKRLNDLVKQIDDLLKAEKCSGVKGPLGKLRDLLDKMRKDFASKDKTFDFIKNDWGNPDASVRWNPSPSWGDHNIEFNPGAKKPWNTVPDDELDSDLFHELTHEHGTDDGEAGNDFNDAHAIDNLMGSDVANWSPFKFLRLKSKCECPR